ncbi:alpha,alpha-trehalose-phosphate synthase (UDP-forming) [Rudaeicoccus suwonensis]|uniref:Trehalose 6-phosphate synthase n=1 Tax=Rudaeicoccus suwonensis TaxID=657409 RepID=A0A561E7Q2_9MICO|nr:trehalose-6-phosphate synthase [Rudaeicoccus suwonensis]TWE11639.1 trehalose 6-phosphate synthase [Rudaeicoccus suwonensis]
MSEDRTFDLVIAANRLPVDRETHDDGSVTWRRSPGGLVTAMESVMRGREGAWIGWSGNPGDAPEPFHQDDMYLHPVPLTEREVGDYYEGFSNGSLWPLYHDVIVPATFKRRWRAAYETVNRRFAEAAATITATGGTVWVQDYQLQEMPAMLRELRPDVRIGWFNHIPFPPVELFMQLPRREDLLLGLLGADFLGFQRKPDADNFLRACRQLLDVSVEGDEVRLPDGRIARAAAVPISIDTSALAELATTPQVQERAAEIRRQLGDPEHLLLGVDRLDYTKGIRHRLKAMGELYAEGALDPRTVKLIQVATPSRERLAAYQQIRGEVERTVGQINGDYSPIGATAVTYLHRSFPREEMAAMFVAADVMLVTPLRDGMNLVAKEYVACHGDDGAMVLSEFTGAALELEQAHLCNPHDIARLKDTIIRAIESPIADRERRMRTMRRQVMTNDVQRWAELFLAALAAAPERPAQ